MRYTIPTNTLVKVVNFYPQIPTDAAHVHQDIHVTVGLLNLTQIFTKELFLILSQQSQQPNFPSDFYAVYDPVTVTLNFDDDNGNTTQTTCTYDGLINLPTPPTREGYDFVGWKIETNNN